MKTMTLTEARNQLLKVAEEMESGKKVMTLSTEVYEALVETWRSWPTRPPTPNCAGRSGRLTRAKGHLGLLSTRSWT